MSDGRYIMCPIEEYNEYLELKEKGKDKPKRPIGDLNSTPHYRCPNCNGGVKMYEDSIVYPYCHHCGQRLLWD